MLLSTVTSPQGSPNSITTPRFAGIKKQGKKLPLFINYINKVSQYTVNVNMGSDQNSKTDCQNEQ
jgi:hypothetical protein